MSWDWKTLRRRRRVVLAAGLFPCMTCLARASSGQSVIRSRGPAAPRPNPAAAAIAPPSLTSLPPGSAESAVPGASVAVARSARPATAFSASSSAAVQAALGASVVLPGDSIWLQAPVITTERGTVILGVKPELPGVTQVALLVERAPFPLAALFSPDGAAAPFEVAVHLERSGRVTALVQADGKWYRVSREVKVAAQPW